MTKEVKNTKPQMTEEELNAAAMALWNDQVLNKFNTYDDDGQFYYLNKDGTYVILLVAEDDPRLNPESFMKTNVRSTYKDNPEPAKNTLLRGYILKVFGGDTDDNSQFQNHLQIIRVPNSVGAQIGKYFVASLQSDEYARGHNIVAVRGGNNTNVYPIKLVRGKKRTKNGEKVDYTVSYAINPVSQDILETAFGLEEAVAWDTAREVYEKINFQGAKKESDSDNSPDEETSKPQTNNDEMMW